MHQHGYSAALITNNYWWNMHVNIVTSFCISSRFTLCSFDKSLHDLQPVCHCRIPTMLTVSSRKQGRLDDLLSWTHTGGVWLPSIFFFHRLQVSVCRLAQRFCPVVAAEALFLNHGQSTEYLESDKTYLLPIWCSLIALRLLLCLRHCQDIPMLIYSWALDFVQWQKTAAGGDGM